MLEVVFTSLLLTYIYSHFQMFTYSTPLKLLLHKSFDILNVCKSIVNVPTSRIVESGSILNSDIVKSATGEILVPLFGSKA